MPGPRPSRVPAWLAGSGVIAIAMTIMNLNTYGFTILAARILGPREYGALAAVMGLLIVVNVASLGLQATGARRVSASPAEAHTIESDMLTATYKSAAAVGVVCLVAAPVVALVLRVDWSMAALIAVTAFPVTLMGGQAGLLQGERRWFSLAVIYVAMGVGRIGFGLVALLVNATALSAMVGVAVGAVLPAIAGHLMLRHSSRRPEGPRTEPGRSRRVLRELVHNSHALLAFFALSNADVVVARVALDEHEAGLYAGGLILAKAVLFLPQFVVVVAFPSMSSDSSRRRVVLAPLATVLGLGVVATLGSVLLPSLAVQFIGGSSYAELEPDIWAFAVVGTIWAMTQLLIYGVVARQDRWMVTLVWFALVALLASSPTIGSLHELLVAVIVIEGLLLGSLLALALRRPVLRPDRVS